MEVGSQMPFIFNILNVFSKIIFFPLTYSSSFLKISILYIFLCVYTWELSVQRPQDDIRSPRTEVQWVENHPAGTGIRACIVLNTAWSLSAFYLPSLFNSFHSLLLYFSN